MALPAIGDGEQIGDGNASEILSVGRSGQAVTVGAGAVNLKLGSAATSLVGFYGTTPVVQRATAASHTTIATTVVVSNTGANMWGFTTSSQGNAVLAAVAEIQATLVAIGIWAA